jgi:hypothetical protein
MARHAQDREDLLRDATALVPRVMLRLAIHGISCDVFAGFRKGSALSVYFDSDPVYHFNNGGELRRAFVGRLILKAEMGKLFVWNQERTDLELTMRSRPLTTAEQQELGAQLIERISQLRDAIQTEQFELIGQTPADIDATGQLQAWLGEFPEFKVAREADVK